MKVHYISDQVNDMCESAVFLLKGSEKILLMPEAARVLVNGDSVTCIDALGERQTIKDVRMTEANLLKHEILLRPR